MASSSGVYESDTLHLPSQGHADSGYVRSRFVATMATMLAQTGATKLLLGDVILLAKLPPQCYLMDYRIYMSAVDTSTGISWDLGDSQILSGAVTGITSGTVALTTPGTAFTLTATASTASFTATNGLLVVGNGLIVNYESLSGSTFVNCRTNASQVVIPSGVAIQQAGNYAAYQSQALTGRSSVAGVITPDYNTTAANTFVTSTAVQNGTPAYIPSAKQTMVGTTTTGTFPSYGNVQPLYFLLRAHAAVTTAATTPVIRGWVGYYMTGPTS